MNPYDAHVYNEDGTVKCDKISLMYVVEDPRCCDGCDETVKCGVIKTWQGTINICKQCLIDIANEIV